MRSRAFALPSASLPLRRSRSYMDLRALLRSFLRSTSSARASTLSSLLLIASSWFSGSLSHCFILRLPMAVPQRSSIPSSEPWTFLSYMVSVISRFLIVALSRLMTDLPSLMLSSPRWTASCFCVSIRYPRRAPTL